MRKRKFRTVLITACLSAQAAIASAQEPAPSALSAEALIEICNERSDLKKSQREAYAQELFARSDLLISSKVQFDGRMCLSRAFSEIFFFDEEKKRFVSQSGKRDQLREKQERDAYLRDVREAAEERQWGYRLEYAKRLQNACYQKLEEDEFLALTNAQCIEVFHKSGFK